jgi:hypothetical protein
MSLVARVVVPLGSNLILLILLIPISILTAYQFLKGGGVTEVVAMQSFCCM